MLPDVKYNYSKTLLSSRYMLGLKLGLIVSEFYYMDYYLRWAVPLDVDAFFHAAAWCVVRVNASSFYRKLSVRDREDAKLILTLI